MAHEKLVGVSHTFGYDLATLSGSKWDFDPKIKEDKAKLLNGASYVSQMYGLLLLIFGVECDGNSCDSKKGHSRG
jgi:hypothetical protein